MYYIKVMLYLWDLNGTKAIFFKCYLLILVFGNGFMIEFEIVLLVIGVVVVVGLLLLVVVVVKGLSALL